MPHIRQDAAEASSVTGCYGQVHGPDTLIPCVAPPGDTAEGGTVRFALPLPVASIVAVPLMPASPLVPNQYSLTTEPAAPYCTATVVPDGWLKSSVPLDAELMRMPIAAPFSVPLSWISNAPAPAWHPDTPTNADPTTCPENVQFTKGVGVSDAVVGAGEPDALDAGEAEATAVPVALEAGEPDAADDGVASAVPVVVLELSPLPHDANAAAARVKTVIVAIARNNANSNESYRPEPACGNLAPAPAGRLHLR
jgi:hypothetical protein